MNINKKTANITGYLYLVIIFGSVFGGMLTGMALESISAGLQVGSFSNWLYGFGFSIYEITYMVELAAAILLYILLKPVNRYLALLAAFFRAAEAIILAFNMQNQFQAFSMMTGKGALPFAGTQLQEYAAMLLDMHHTGYLISQLFFGVHCLLIGYLIYQSRYFPKWIGTFLLAAGGGYLLESFAYFLVPNYESVAGIFSIISAVPAVLAEFTLTFWLIFKGKIVETRFSTLKISELGNSV